MEERWRADGTVAGIDIAMDEGASTAHLALECAGVVGLDGERAVGGQDA